MRVDSRWYAHDNIMRQQVELVLFQDGPDCKRVGRSDITMFPHEEGSCVSEPTLALTRDDTQQIMNELWRIGIRPKDGNGGLAHTEAIQGHLSDMRKIVSAKLNVDLP